MRLATRASKVFLSTTVLAIAVAGCSAEGPSTTEDMESVTEALVPPKTDFMTIPYGFWWFRSNGDGSVTAQVLPPNDLPNKPFWDFWNWASPTDVKHVAGDFDGDGNNDIALLRNSYGSIPIAFTRSYIPIPVSNEPVAGFPQWATQPNVKVFVGAVNDVNRSRQDMVLIGGAGWNSIPVAMVQNNGVFTIVNGENSAFAGWSRIAGTTPISGDFNGDGRMDIALLNGTFGSIPVALANGNGTFRVINPAAENFPAWSGTAGAVPIVGRFNNSPNDSGRQQIALTGASGWGSVPVAALRLDETAWAISNPAVSQFPAWAAIANVSKLPGDFNGDGLTDIALSGASGWNSIPVAFSAPTIAGPGFNVTNMNVATVPGVAATHRPVVGDFDGNGKSDIAVVQKKDGCSNCLTTLPIAMSRGDGRFLVTNVDSGDVRMLQHSFGTRSLPQSTFVGNFVSEQ